MKRIAVFASGRGSNFQAIVDAANAGELEAVVSLLVCDRPGAYCIERAEKAGIPAFAFNAKDFKNKEDYEQEILNQLQRHNVEFIVLAGYMRLIGTTLLRPFAGNIVNIHPSLLPEFPGKDAIGQALNAKAKWSGVTIHFVDDGMDTGPIIVQERVRLEEDETREGLQEKIHKIEHKLYPSILHMLLTKGGVLYDKQARTN